MAVVAVAFGREAEKPQPLLTMFCVQSFWRDRDRLVKGRFEQFANMESALRGGKFAANRSAAVLVYRVRGSAKTGFWDEPVTLARLGVAKDELPPPPPPGFR